MQVDLVHPEASSHPGVFFEPSPVMFSLTVIEPATAASSSSTQTPIRPETARQHKRKSNSEVEQEDGGFFIFLFLFNTLRMLTPDAERWA